AAINVSASAPRIGVRRSPCSATPWVCAHRRGSSAFSRSLARPYAHSTCPTWFTIGAGTGRESRGWGETSRDVSPTGASIADEPTPPVLGHDQPFVLQYGQSLPHGVARGREPPAQLRLTRQRRPRRKLPAPDLLPQRRRDLLISVRGSARLPGDHVPLGRDGDDEPFLLQQGQAAPDRVAGDAE